MNVLVIGSINTDFVVESEVLPQLGETVLGKNFSMHSGGKGANQAVAAARLGAKVSIIAAVGNDSMGQREIEILKQEKIDTTGIVIKNGISTGIAVITLSKNDNCIIVIGGANLALSIDDVEKNQHKIQSADVIVCSLEIPLECVQYACWQAKRYNKHFILNPAPAQNLPDELLENATLITPNVWEYAKLFRLPENAGNNDVVHHFQQYSLPNTLMTCGIHGVLYHHNHLVYNQPAFEVGVVDTTGAGDTFNGALAAFFDLPRTEAIRYACAAASLSVTRHGARNGMPSAQELEKFLEENGA